MKSFLEHFYNLDALGGTLVSDQAFQASWNTAVAASAAATVACIPTWETDFRGDLPKIDVPVLIVQGDADRILPFVNTGKRLPGLSRTWISSSSKEVPTQLLGPMQNALTSFCKHDSG
jgi:non-heme chloroperoxidase